MTALHAGNTVFTPSMFDALMGSIANRDGVYMLVPRSMASLVLPEDLLEPLPIVYQSDSHDTIITFRHYSGEVLAVIDQLAITVHAHNVHAGMSDTDLGWGTSIQEVPKCSK